MESRAHRSVEWMLSALELTAVRGDHGSREQERNSVHKLGMDGQTAKHLTEMFRESEFCCGSMCSPQTIGGDNRLCWEMGPGQVWRLCHPCQNQHLMTG